MVNKRTRTQKTRKPHQRKPALKGRKSLRGCPEMYDELKKTTTLALTQTAISGLDEISSEMGVSRSELVERIGRKLLEIATVKDAPIKQEVQ